MERVILISIPFAPMILRVPVKALMLREGADEEARSTRQDALKTRLVRKWFCKKPSHFAGVEV
jgi:hypothetical protein